MRGRNSDERNERRPTSKAVVDRAQRGLQVVQRVRPGIERGQRIDQHDLPVEPRKMIAEERPHQRGHVGVVAPLHHRPERAGRRFAVERHLERRKSQRRRAGDAARQQETPGRQQAHGVAFVAAGFQVGGEQFCRGQRLPARRPSRPPTGSPDARAIRRQGAAAARRATAPGSPPTIARSSCRAAAGRAATRRDSRRCRGVSERAAPLRR